jgi:hypothetical protein
MSELPPEQVAAELLRRQRSRASLVEFSQSIEIPGVPLIDVIDEEDEKGRLKNRFEREKAVYSPIESRIAKHHLLMMKKIQTCIETSRGRLMVFCPPGSAKSTYGSVLAPAWAMGRKPNTQVILASYATTIAAKQSRKVRSIMRDPRYAAIWAEKPTLLDDQRAVDDWQLTNGSSMMAAGLLAGITGNRCDLLVLDDPVANREQADSPTLREKTYNEYIDTALTRAKPHMSVLLIMTRWNEEDLAGAILPADYAGESGAIKCRDGQTWEVLSIPAEAEREDDPLGRKPGEFLWTEWFSREHWATWRDNPRAARTWSALYQQRPAPLTGIFFNREMFQRFDLDKARMDT